MDAFSQTSDQSEDEDSESSSDSDIVDGKVLTSSEYSKIHTTAYRGPPGKFLLK